MRALRITELFAEHLHSVARQFQDPVACAATVHEIAAHVAHGRAPTWSNDHPLHGAYAGYSSFKPLREDRDVLVIYLAHPRVLVLADIGRHDRFFTKGRKTKPPNPGSLKAKPM